MFTSLSDEIAVHSYIIDIADSNNRPSTEPCGTPDSTGRVAELQPSILTN